MLNIQAGSERSIITGLLSIKDRALIRRFGTSGASGESQTVRTNDFSVKAEPGKLRVDGRPQPPGNLFDRVLFRKYPGHKPFGTVDETKLGKPPGDTNMHIA